MALSEIRFFSTTLQLSVGCNVILPEHPDAWKEPPAVLYLLHGLSGDHTSWVRNSSIERYARDYNLVVVMPDAYKSFYSNMTYGSDYWAYFTQELPQKIHTWFNVTSKHNKTFIAGSSMGGYGAIRIALGCPDQFCAAASLSGALDLPSHLDGDWDETHQRTFKAVFGNTLNIKNSDFDLMAQLHSIETAPSTEFYACCGIDDWLYQDSVTFRDVAAAKGLYLTYEEAGGAHNWKFWNDHIERVLEWLPMEKLEKVAP